MSAGIRTSLRATAAASIVALAMTLAAGPASAAQKPEGTPTPTVTSSVSNLPTDKIPSRDVSGPGTVEIQGVKSWLVKQALKGVAGGIRGGASTFIRLADNWLDAAATKALRKNSGRIADVIEDVAEIPDIASHQVRSQVYNGLKGFLGHGTANVIANAVEGVMWILL